jgi:hypothetical protein
VYLARLRQEMLARQSRDNWQKWIAPVGRFGGAGYDGRAVGHLETLPDVHCAIRPPSCPSNPKDTGFVPACLRETMMRSTILFLIAAGLLNESGAASAQSPTSYPWCAREVAFRGDVTSCYYTSREQCMATISGIGVYCYRSPYYHATPAKAAERVRRHRAPN